MKNRRRLFAVAIALLSVISYADAGQECDLNISSCTREAGDLKATLDISPKPVKAMTVLNFTLVIKNEKPGRMPDRIVLDLSMPEMFMGFNRVVLIKTAERIYKGSGVIPRCRSGEKRWIAEARISADERVSYAFDLSY